jgi:hypothetical protein
MSVEGFVARLRARERVIVTEIKQMDSSGYANKSRLRKLKAELAAIHEAIPKALRKGVGFTGGGAW